VQFLFILPSASVQQAFSLVSYTYSQVKSKRSDTEMRQEKEVKDNTISISFLLVGLSVNVTFIFTLLSLSF
jgi:hypothetical protein